MNRRLSGMQIYFNIFSATSRINIKTFSEAFEINILKKYEKLKALKVFN